MLLKWRMKDECDKWDEINSFLEEIWSFVEGQCMFSTQDLTVDNPLVICSCVLGLQEATMSSISSSVSSR